MSVSLRHIKGVREKLRACQRHTLIKLISAQQVCVFLFTSTSIDVIDIHL